MASANAGHINPYLFGYRNPSCCGCGASPSNHMRQLSLIRFPVAVLGVVVVVSMDLFPSSFEFLWVGGWGGGQGRGAFISFFSFFNMTKIVLRKE